VSESAASPSKYPLATSIPDGTASLESILYTEELQSRPSRPPNYEKENHALRALVSALADSPSTIFQTLAETIQDITQCDSAGLSLLTRDGKTPDVGGQRFYWPAITGMWSPHVGGGTPRDFGPCGDVLDCNRTLLFRHFERRYPYLVPVSPSAEECLLVPFYVGGKAVGTIWAIMHSDRRKFDAEDNRVMNSLEKFASSAYQAVMSIDDLKLQVAKRENAEAGLRELNEGLEKEVQARTEELSLIIETIPGLVWCAAPDGELNYLNRRILDYTGSSPEAWAQLGWANFLHSDDAEPTVRAWSRAVATGQSYENQFRLRRSDGVYRWFNVLGQAARDNEGRVTRWYGLLIDIDDQRNIEEALRDSQTRLSRATRTATVGEFAASIAHEINQPLAAVTNNASACLRLLASRNLEPEVLRRVLEEIVSDGARASAVIARIRAFIKQEPPERKELDVNAVIQGVLALAGRELSKNRVLLELQLTTPLPPVLADRVQLQQVLLNLIMNGIEAMVAVTDRPRVLWVQSQVDESGDVLVAVRDSGAGLSLEGDSVFAPFFTTKANGLGMGLSISRSLVESHGGRLWATPNSPNGTVFSFTVPVSGERSS
jgi:PAS domain S-box-containing protein